MCGVKSITENKKKREKGKNKEKKKKAKQTRKKGEKKREDKVKELKCVVCSYLGKEQSLGCHLQF